jgi:ribosomal protein S18 acetylase RimI-like enzyme
VKAVQWQCRPASPADAGFLASLFRSTRPELAMLPAGLAERIANDQQRLQEAGYRASWPEARFLVIEGDGDAVGRLVLATLPDALRVVDLAVAPAARGRGCASSVLRALQEQAVDSGASVVLSVAHDNANARRLYAALGFVEEARDEVRATLRWRPAPPVSTPALP